MPTEPVIAPQAAGPPTTAGARRRRFKETGLLGVVVALGLLLSVFGGSIQVRDRGTGETRAVNKFLRADNLDKLAKNTSFFAIMAVGATLVIVAGGIDLSVGSIYCLAAVCGAMFLHRFGPQGAGAGASATWVVPAAILVCLGVGTGCGLLNGLGVVLLRVHPFVITLGTMAIYRGIAFVMTKAQAYTHFPAQFTDGLIRYEVGHNLYPVPMTIMVAITVLAAVYLKFTVTGRQIFAIGGNEQAARYSGLPVERVKLKVYAFSGLMAGVAAMIMLGYYGAASSDAGKGYELDVIAAAVVGGASLSGGRGSALGALLGALIIQMINNGIIILEIDQNYSQIIIGAVIIVAVVLDRINTALRERRLANAARLETKIHRTEKRMNIDLKLLALATIAAGLLAGCGQEPSAPAPAAKQKEYVFALIAKNQGNPVFQAARTGAEDAARDLSQKLGVPVKVQWQTPNEDDAQKQVEFLEQMVVQGVDGISISVVIADTLTPAIDKAVQQGVAVMCFDSDAPRSKRFAFYGTDDFAAGQLIMRELVKELGPGKHVVGIPGGNQNAANIQNRIKGALDEAKKHPDITIKGPFYSKETPQDAAARMEEVQTANPDIDGWAMIGSWALFTDALLKWEPGKVKIVAMDALPAELPYVRKGVVARLYAQQTYQWGYRSIEILADKVINKKDPAVAVEYSPLPLVDKSNADQMEQDWKKWLRQ